MRRNVFRYIRLVTIVTLKPGLGVTQGHRNRRVIVDPPPMTSYWRSIVTMGLCRTVCEINGYFSRKSQNFPTPVYFAPWLGSPWNWVSALGVQKLEWWGYQKVEKVLS